jgi:hypothetical protein
MIRTLLRGMNAKARSQGRRSQESRARLFWRLEGMERRVLLSGGPTIYTVSVATDNGPTSAGSGTGNTGDLRYCINLASADPNPAGTTIEFDPTAFATAQTITLSPTLGTLPLADTAGPEVIDGPGAGLLTLSGGNAVGVFSVGSGVNAGITGVTITGGSASSGAAIDNSGTLAVASDVFSGNTALAYGGAIFNSGGTLSVANSSFSNNTATYGRGGAIDNDANGSASVANSTFFENLAFQGGAIDNNTGTLTIAMSTLLNNSGCEGGGIYNDATATVTASTIANNTTAPGVTGTITPSFTSFDGGGIANDFKGNLTLIDSTLAGNIAGQNGGCIDTVGILTATNDTIADNSIAIGGTGGGVDASAGTATFNNTLIAQNTVGLGTAASPSDLAGTVAALSADNLTGTGGSGGMVNGVNGNLVGVANPNLGTLADNGGPTETIALLDGSPAIDAGSNALAVDRNGNALTTDERGAGYPRVVNGTVDIGAYEAGTVSVFTVDLTSDTGASTSQSAGDLLYCVSQANVDANPSGVKIEFDHTVFTTAAPETIALSSGALDLTNTSTSISIVGPGANLVTITGSSTDGAVEVAGGVTASISGLTISGGTAAPVDGASGDGGAIDNFGTLTLTGLAITGNTASNGGGIANEVGGTLTLSDSTLSGNTCASGGGLYNAGKATVTNIAVAHNNGVLGAGIFNVGSLTVVSATIADNAVIAGGVGGGVDAAAGSTGLYDTIVAQNTSGTASGSPASDVAGTVLPASANNLIGTGGSGGLATGTNGNLVGVASPGLGSLANNGGTTQTIALLAGSPAIAAGSSTIAGVTVPTTDQRGDARPSGSIDIGAYQFSTATVTPIRSGAIGGAASASNQGLSYASAAVGVPRVTQAAPAPAAAVPTVIGSKQALPNAGLATRFRTPRRDHTAVKAKHASVRAHRS